MYPNWEEFSIDYRNMKSFSDQLSDFINKQIEIGNLKPGDKMPTVRQAAVMLNLGVVTVNNAYKKMIQEKILESHGRHGVFVADQDKLSVPQCSEKWEDMKKEEQTFLTMIEPAMLFGKKHGILLDRLLELVTWLGKKERVDGGIENSDESKD